MRKRLLPLLCALALLLAALPSTAALEGEARQAARTLVSLHVLDSVPNAETLKKSATRVQSTELLVRLDGVTASDRAVSAQEYAISKGWVANSGGQQEPIPTAEFCASLLRMLGYDPIDDGKAALYARRVGLTTQDYDAVLTCGDLYELVRDALVYPDSNGVTLAQNLVNKNVCTQAEISSFFPTELSARQIADRHMSAIFRLDTYYTENAYKKGLKSNGGSGFFITEDGLAVTNYHTIDGAVLATASLVTGETFAVERVLFYDIEADIALLRISKTTTDGKTEVPRFSFLEIAEEPELRHGDHVYTMGVPLGLTWIISDGIISATNHKIEGYSLPGVINTADISHGSSGGALLNVLGHVVGVTTGAYSAGNNMYISVPLTLIQEADWTVEGITLDEVKKQADALFADN